MSDASLFASKSIDETSGWDMEMFVETEKAAEFQCMVCQEVVRQATQLDCGHLFCELCLSKALVYSKVCPTCRAPASEKAAHPSAWHRRAVLNMHVRCPTDLSCQWAGTLRQLPQHLCTGFSVDSNQIGDSASPDSFEVECAIQTSIADTGPLSSHSGSESKCGVPHASFVSGVSGVSAASTVAAAPVVSDVISSTKIASSALKYQADIKGLRCQFVKVKCPWCHERVARKHVLSHKTVCNLWPIECGNCRAIVSPADNIDHLGKYCPEALIACSWGCAIMPFKRKHKANHERHCTKMVISCPLRALGCTQSFRREKLEAHLSDTLSQHLLQAAFLSQMRIRRLEQLIGVPPHLPFPIDAIAAVADATVSVNNSAEREDERLLRQECAEHSTVLA